MSGIKTPVASVTAQTEATPAVASKTRRYRPAKWVGVVVAIGVVGAGIGAASNPTSAIDVTDGTALQSHSRVLTVETIRAEPVSAFTAAREYTGAIVARRVSELSFERSGLLQSVQIDEGKTVAAGVALATLDTEHLKTQRRETVARRAQAASLLREMIAGPRREDIDAAGAAVESLEAQVELLKLQTERSRKLLQQNAVSQDDFDQFAFGLRAREGQLKRARHELKELVNGTRQEQVDAQQAVVEQLDAAIEDIDVDLRKSELRAPFAGTISHRLADEGTVVQTGQAILTIIEDSALEAWVGLPVDAANLLHVNSALGVRIEGRTFDVHVSCRRPEVDPATRTRTVIFRLDPSASDYVVHGQIVRLQLEETVEASGYWLPTTALTEGERGLWSCLVAVPDETHSSRRDALRVERRDVEVLHTESNRVLVRGTLNAGDRVIATGTHRVSVGQRVTSIEE